MKNTKKLFPPIITMITLLTILATIITVSSTQSLAQDGGKTTNLIEETQTDITEVMRRFEADIQAPMAIESLGLTACVGGSAGSYPCNNVDLLAFMPLNTIGGGSGNDIWGWTDSSTGKEYALMGRTNGTAFVDISDPVNPVYLGNLPTQNFNSSWRDIKVYADHAFIVSEATNHGMQIFDLTQLRNVSNPPVTFSNSAHYNGFGSAHNVVINEASGYAYGVGTSNCSGGLHMVNIQNPTSPTNAGCYSGDGYTHDAQCVIYTGPDTEHQGKEICFNYNEDTLTIVDVTTKSSPVMLSRTGYNGSEYTHQGWLTDDQAYVLLGDELDESRNGHNVRTYIWDVSNLDAPVHTGTHTGNLPNIDHNLYIKGNYAYQAQYRAGLRILDISNISSASLSEVAYFDIYPSSDSPNYNGAWSNYPYFDSGVVIISGIEQGLFIVQPNLGPQPTPTPSPTPAPTATPDPNANTHIGDLDGSGKVSRKQWDATVIVTVHDGAENPVSGATVNGNWDGSDIASCVTNASGQCSVTKTRIKGNTTSVNFSVSSVTFGSYPYLSANNHDPDGDSNGTTITVNKPAFNLEPSQAPIILKR